MPSGRDAFNPDVTPHCEGHYYTQQTWPKQVSGHTLMWQRVMSYSVTN
jgi:hypothetical protein